MSEPFVAEIRIFGFNFAPRGWATCDGQLIAIQQNTALFSLLGTTYGGDGKTTFALPNLQAAAPMQPGQGPGLSNRTLGEGGGSPTVTLVSTQMPQHTHTLQSQGAPGNRSTPVGGSFARVQGGTPYIPQSPTPPLVPLAPQAVGPQGNSQPHNNVQPFLTVSFCIALQGVYPPRS